jgi:pimeloyl-ACP methyl ester carboxylesterase
MAVSRRGLIATAGIAAAVAAAPVRAAKARRTFVLVHGAWHGGWCWRDVAAELRRRGHSVFTPTLTGMGERLHLGRPDTNMSTHSADVAAVIAAEELSDAVLVAHSYAGIPCSYVTDGVARLVYLDSLLPTPGKSMVSGLAPAAVKGVEAALDGGFRLPSFPPEQFTIPVDHPRYAWVKRRLTSMPWPALTEVHPRLPDAHLALPKTYVRCTQSTLPDSGRAAEEAKARGLRVVDFDAGHDAMVTAPTALAKLLIALA